MKGGLGKKGDAGLDEVIGNDLIGSGSARGLSPQVVGAGGIIGIGAAALVSVTIG